MPHRLIIEGCRTTPLSSYLKSLGVLRILAEQRDPCVKGHWEGDCFALTTELTLADLERFFCQDYSPTPIVAPWNGGSGFYAGDNREGIDAIITSSHDRFKAYRNVISQIRSWDEMPKPLERVGDVVRTLQSEINTMQPSKRRGDLQKLLGDMDRATPPREDLEGRDPMEIGLAELVHLAKAKGQPRQKLLSAWWNTVKKGRSSCTGSERSENKERILAACRSRLPQVCLEWVDAVCALHPEQGSMFNPVLGTGANEGRLDFSNNFMQNLKSLLMDMDPPQTRALLQSSLFNAVLPGLPFCKAGQYDPGRAGGYNQGMEIETKEFKFNPWDFVLMFEGTLVLGSSLSRRNQAGQKSAISSPFTVRFSPVGFTSSAYTEGGRMETWLPAWHKPASYREVKYLFGEGRSEVGGKQAQTGLEFSRAVASLGVDRGIKTFERFTFLERRGKSYVALPAGRFSVQYNPGVELLNEVDLLTTPLERFLREFRNAPAIYLSAKRQIDEAIFSCTRQPEPRQFSSLVRALGRMERLIAFRDRSKKPSLPRPLYGLSPRWITLADDGTIEARISAAVASIRSTGKVGTIRSNLADTAPASPSRWGEQGGQQHWFGSNLCERLGGVLNRRITDAEKLNAPLMPLESEISLTPFDVMPYLWGTTDDIKIEELLWGFSLINWRKQGLSVVQRQINTPLVELPLSRTWALLKLLHLPRRIRDITIKHEPRIVRLLSAGRIGEAIEVAFHRLRVSQLNPLIVDYDEKLQAERLLASLLVPIRGQRILESLVLQEEHTPG